MTNTISLLPRHCGTDDGTAAPTALDPRVLLSSMVHDFNILLTPIVSVLEEMQSRGAGTARQLKKIDGAIYCAFRAKTLARQLLDFASKMAGEPQDKWNGPRPGDCQATDGTPAWRAVDRQRASSRHHHRSVAAGHVSVIRRLALSISRTKGDAQ